MLAFLVSCNQDQGNPKVEDPESYEVTLYFGGEFVLEQEPLSRGVATNNIYAINVWYDKEKDGDSNDIYAYGLFNNTEDMSISLLSGYTYKFDCTLVKNGQQTLYYGPFNGRTASGFITPFKLGNNSASVINKFEIGGSMRFDQIGNGRASLAGSTAVVKTPSIERYYGETSGYRPTKNGSVTINLVKAYFGAHFVIKGMDGGKLSLNCSGDDGEFYSANYTENDEGVDRIYCFYNTRECWKNSSDYAITGNLSYSYTAPSTTNMTYSGDAVITFRRNVMTTITIDVSHPSVGLSVNEPGEIINENNINLEINTDGVIDIVVNPNENE